MRVAPWLPSRWRSSKRAAGVIDRPCNARVLHDLRLPTMKTVWPSFAERADKEGWPAARFLAAVAEHELAPPPMRDRLTAEIDV